MDFDFSYLDMAFINGQVVTVNEKDEICEAVGIKKIITKGGYEWILIFLIWTWHSLMVR